MTINDVKVGDKYYFYDKFNLFIREAKISIITEETIMFECGREFQRYSREKFDIVEESQIYYHQSLFENFEDFQNKFREALKISKQDQAIKEAEEKLLNETRKHNAKIPETFRIEMRHK